MITTIKKCFSLFILFLSIYSSYAQNDTIYYSENWKVVQQKDSASFYRLPVTKKGDLYLIQDFFISGKKQIMIAQSFWGVGYGKDSFSSLRI